MSYTLYMKQVLVIHGGDSFAAYEEYIAFLKEMPVELEGSKGWKGNLNEALGPKYQVILPRMPNSFNAKYEEWKIWFEKYLALLDEDLILVGHSLGGSFLAKYLATESVPLKIRATFLIAAPHDTDGERALVEFDSPEDLTQLQAQGGEIFMYHSTDDPIVAFSEFEKFQAALPDARFRSFTDRGHFLQEEFPELVTDIKNLV